VGPAVARLEAAISATSGPQRLAQGKGGR
jgi:hypothetical protein